jgi:hypothetical protein
MAASLNRRSALATMSRKLERLAGVFLVGCALIVAAPEAAPAQSLVGHVYVLKVVAPDPLNIGHTLVFTLNQTCTDSSGAQQSTTVQVQGDNNPALSVPVPAGSHCTLVEAASLPTLPQGCSWFHLDSPTISYVGGATLMTVKNGYQCQAEPATVTVRKIVDPDPLHIGAATHVAMKLTCSNDPQSPHLFSVVGGGDTSVSVPVNSYCTLGETLPLIRGCHWLAPIYTPGKSGTVPSGTHIVTVQNGYECGTPPVARIDLSVRKTGPVHIQGGLVGFTVTVTNVGAAFNMPSGGIVVSDAATGPPGVITAITTNPAGSWDCAWTGSSAHCAYLGSGPVAQSQGLGTLDITYQLFTAGTVKNCATVATTTASNLHDVNPANDTACVSGR